MSVRRPARSTALDTPVRAGSTPARTASTAMFPASSLRYCGRRHFSEGSRRSISKTVNSDRILVIAPHPDDEVIGAGGLIQRAGDVRVVFVTSGENNPWPQRVMQRKWIISAADRAEWATMRRREAAASLHILGAPDDSAVFLGFRDQEIMPLARQ